MLRAQPPKWVVELLGGASGTSADSAATQAEEGDADRCVLLAIVLDCATLPRGLSPPRSP
eukprot:10461737-Alexandrium_andersonii.AAC.1